MSYTQVFEVLAKSAARPLIVFISDLQVTISSVQRIGKSLGTNYGLVEHIPNYFIRIFNYRIQHCKRLHQCRKMHKPLKHPRQRQKYSTWSLQTATS